jgi:glucosylceramidase
MFTWFWRSFKRVEETKEKFPNKFILGTEACFESFSFLPPFKTGPDLGSWHRGEIYAYDIINDLNSGVSGWTDWNMVLDLEGGPNWVKNYVDSPIIVDSDNWDVYYKQPMFYFMGHFSKFLLQNSVRVEHKLVNPGPLDWIGIGFDPYITTFLRPDRILVVTVLNMGFWEKEYELRIKDDLSFKHKIAKHTIQTILIQV